MNSLTLATAVARNVAHGFIGTTRGGHRVSRWSPEEQERHAQGQCAVLAPYIGDIRGKIGIEIGPGDSFGLCNLLLKQGAAHMYAVEKFGGSNPPDGVTLMADTAEEFELPEGQEADFAMSNDVLEHVHNIRETFANVCNALKRGGVFASSVDLRGHNCWKDEQKPLEFLTCPDWLYALTTSNIETSNRVRFDELVAAADYAGFRVTQAHALAVAHADYIAALRPRLQDRYKNDSNLAALQVLIVAEKQ